MVFTVHLVHKAVGQGNKRGTFVPFCTSTFRFDVTEPTLKLVRHSRQTSSLKVRRQLEVGNRIKVMAPGAQGVLSGSI